MIFFGAQGLFLRDVPVPALYFVPTNAHLGLFFWIIFFSIQGRRSSGEYYPYSILITLYFTGVMCPLLQYRHLSLDDLFWRSEIIALAP